MGRRRSLSYYYEITPIFHYYSLLHFPLESLSVKFGFYLNKMTKSHQEFSYLVAHRQVRVPLVDPIITRVDETPNFTDKLSNGKCSNE